MNALLKWRIRRLESKISSLETQKKSLQKRLLLERGAIRRWRSNLSTMQMRKNTFTKS